MVGLGLLSLLFAGLMLPAGAISNACSPILHRTRMGIITFAFRHGRPLANFAGCCTTLQPDQIGDFLRRGPGFPKSRAQRISRHPRRPSPIRPSVGGWWQA